MPQINQSLITCRSCGSHSTNKYLLSKDLNQEKDNNLFSYYLCDNCESIFLHPIPNNLGFYYGQDYPAYATNKSICINDDLEYGKLEFIKQYVSSGKLVEIGPAAGRFLSVANSAGYNVLGIEQDIDCVDYIKKTLNLDVKHTDKPNDELLQLTADNDVIVAWHVIEHLQDLRGFAYAASQALRKPNGIIVISAPNPKAWSFKLFRQYWVHLDAPRHLTLIPVHALDDLMTEQGLERIACTFNDAVGLQLNRMGWQLSLMNMSRNKKIRKPWLAKLGRILSIAMIFLDKMSNRGAAYTVVYRKKTPL